MNLYGIEIDIVNAVASFIALLALFYTIYSTKKNRQLDVMPFIQYERVTSGLDLSDSESIKNHSYDYKMFLNKEKKLIGLENWESKHIEIMKNEQKISNGVAYGIKNYPVCLRLKNVGPGLAINFVLELSNGRCSMPVIFSKEDEKIIALLLEDIEATFNLTMCFKDIYGVEYKEKIEFFKGNIAFDVSIKRTKFNFIKQKWQKIIVRKKIEKGVL